MGSKRHKLNGGGLIEKALSEYHEESEHSWNLMFMELKEIVETVK